MRLSIRLVILILFNKEILKFAWCDYWEYKLTHDILNGYDPSIRPSIHHNKSVNVTFGLSLTQIIDVVRFKSFSIYFGILN